MNLLKKLPILILLLTFCNFSIAQSNLEEVVYLKNGKIFRGLIIEQIPNQSLKIQTKEGVVHLFQMDEVAKITKEVVSKSEVVNLDLDDDEGYEPKFSNQTELVYSSGFGKLNFGGFTFPNKLNSWGIRTINGVRSSEGFMVGIGTGLDFYENFTLLPITFDTRFDLTGSKVRPILNINLGYSVGLGNSIYRGIVGNSSLGVKIFLSNFASCHFLVGLKGQVFTFGKNDVLHQNIFFTSGLSF
jgi:hypothetical protein